MSNQPQSQKFFPKKAPQEDLDLSLESLKQSEKKLEEKIKSWQENTPLMLSESPSRKFCIEVASKLPNANLSQLFDNAEQIYQWISKPKPY